MTDETSNDFIRDLAEAARRGGPTVQVRSVDELQKMLDLVGSHKVAILRKRGGRPTKQPRAHTDFERNEHFVDGAMSALAWAMGFQERVWPSDQKTLDADYDDAYNGDFPEYEEDDE
jgi:hypothetical protein